MQQLAEWGFSFSFCFISANLLAERPLSADIRSPGCFGAQLKAASSVSTGVTREHGAGGIQRSTSVSVGVLSSLHVAVKEGWKEGSVFLGLWKLER